VIQLYCVLL